MRTDRNKKGSRRCSMPWGALAARCKRRPRRMLKFQHRPSGTRGRRCARATCTCGYLLNPRRQSDDDGRQKYKIPHVCIREVYVKYACMNACIYGFDDGYYYCLLRVPNVGDGVACLLCRRSYLTKRRLHRVQQTERTAYHINTYCTVSLSVNSCFLWFRTGPE